MSYRITVKIEQVARASMGPRVRDRTVLEMVTQQETALKSFEVAKRIIDGEMLAEQLQAEEKDAVPSRAAVRTRTAPRVNIPLIEDEEEEED